jgi:molybdopterin converting factor subunit 1
MRVRVRLFARLREIAGASELEYTVDGARILADVWDALVRDHPAMAPYCSSISGAINADYARLNDPVHDGDEVAFLPPVSGG